MVNGKNINLFLKNGTFEGVVEATIGGKQISGYRVGRDENIISSEQNLSNPGVYLLFCGGPTDGVYIGESIDVQARLKQHIRDYKTGKEQYYWTEALCFVDPSLTVVTKYCEAKLVSDAKAAQSYVLLTRASGIPPIKDSTKADMDNFVEDVELLVSTFGKTVFVNVGKIANKNPSSVYYYKNAKMFITQAGFVVMAGSEISLISTNSLSKELISLRGDLIKKGIIDSKGILTKDIVLGSVSAAAKFVSGYSTRGTEDWKDSSGMSIGSKNN